MSYAKGVSVGGAKWRERALAVTCPVCGAAPKQFCKQARWKRKDNLHAGRIPQLSKVPK